MDRIDEHEVGRQRGVVLGERRHCGGRGSPPRAEQAVVGVECGVQHLGDPGLMERFDGRIFAVHGVAPLLIGASQTPSVAEIVEPLREHLAEHGNGQERPRHFNQIQPLVVVAHAVLRVARDSGTTNTTATGKECSTRPE